MHSRHQLDDGESKSHNLKSAVLDRTDRESRAVSHTYRARGREGVSEGVGIVESLLL